MIEKGTNDQGVKIENLKVPCVNITNVYLAGFGQATTDIFLTIGRPANIFDLDEVFVECFVGTEFDIFKLPDFNLGVAESKKSAIWTPRERINISGWFRIIGELWLELKVLGGCEEGTGITVGSCGDKKVDFRVVGHGTDGALVRDVVFDGYLHFCLK